MKVVGTKLDNSEYDDFDVNCSDCGMTKSEKLRELIKKFIENPDEDDEIKRDLDVVLGKVYDKDGTLIGTIKGFDDSDDKPKHHVATVTQIMDDDGTIIWKK